jgi:hypothetical protein
MGPAHGARRAARCKSPAGWPAPPPQSRSHFARFVGTLPAQLSEPQQGASAPLEPAPTDVPPAGEAPEAKGRLPHCQARAPTCVLPVRSMYHTRAAARPARPPAHACLPAGVPTYAHVPARPRAPLTVPRSAQVAGCTAVLSAAATPRYRLRYRLCETHLRADSVLVRGVAMRFCQARPALTHACTHARHLNLF